MATYGQRAAWAAAAGALILTAATRAQPQGDYSGSCIDAACHGGYLKKASIHQPAKTGSCDACHEQVTGHPHRFQLTVASDELCAECHDDVTEEHDYLHGPVATGACVACHDPHASELDALLIGPTPELCIGCHTTLGKLMESSAHTHPPAKEDCTVCHNPHGSASKLFLSSRPPEMCVDCHDDIAEIMEDATVGHDAMTSGKSCTACHNPHASTRKHLLIAESMELCLSCHDRELSSGDGKLRNIGQLLAENPDHHGPIRDRDCTACHQPHGGDYYRLLVGRYPARFYADFEEEEYALCFECHDSEMVLEAETDESTGFRNGERNLHHVHVNRAVKGRTCGVCHDVHASTAPSHITKTVSFGQWDLPINFQKTETGGSCAPGCHKPYRYDRDSAVENLPRPGSEKR